MRKRGAWALAAVPAVVALAACGPAGGDGIASAGGGTAKPSASASRSMSPQDAMVAFTRCMRQHGVPMDDPKVDGHGMRVGVRAKNVPRAKMDAAQKACGHFMAEGGKPPGLDDPKARDRMLKFARCMRQHGVKVADPKPGQGIKIEVDKGARAHLEAAQKACKRYEGGGPGSTSVGGGA